MKLKHYILTAALTAALLPVTTSCSDDMSEQLRSEAKIESYAITVKSSTGNVYQTKVSEDGHTIYIKINPFIDIAAELSEATPTFYLSMGATVTPPMTEAQNFSDLDNPVEYTVTSGDGKHVEKYYVTYTISDKIPMGEGFTHGEDAGYKTYTELGFPGTYASWVTWEDIVDTKKGDLLAFPSFCGKDHLVIFARRYAWGDDGSENPKNAMAADPSNAFRVYDRVTLAEQGSLNLGNISAADVVAVSSDWGGNMVAAVGRKSAGKTDFYYWTSPDASPVHIGTSNVSVEIGNHSADGGSYINIAGDITGDALIAAAAPRDTEGSHYKFFVRDGQLRPEPEIIHTGHSSNDKAWFQMISFFGPEDNAPYLVGDTEDNKPEDNGQIRVYLNNSNGTNRATMDYHTSGVNGWRHDDGEDWWSRSGKWMSRGGGRRPTVNAMVINGKPYSYWTTGTDWRNRGILMDQELKTVINQYPTFGFGKCTREKNTVEPNNGSIWLPYSFGCMADWMFDEESQEGYVAVWSDRFGLNTFKLTCYE